MQAQNAARTTIASASAAATAGNYELEYTIGEVAIGATMAEPYQLSAGFHQPEADSTSATFSIDVGLDIQLLLYPNPSSESVQVVLPAAATEALTLELFTADGRIVHQSHLPVGALQQLINVTALSRGTYIVRLRDGAGRVSIPYPLIKQ